MSNSRNFKAITVIKDASLQMSLGLVSGFFCPTTYPLLFVLQGLKTSSIVSHPCYTTLLQAKMLIILALYWIVYKITKFGYF